MSKLHGPLTNWQLVRLAWRIVGGWAATHRSWHFRLAMAVWLCCAPIWLAEDWWQDVTSILPNLLGFTLGGFAIFLGFGSDSFKEMIASDDEERAEYLSVSAAFLTFVLIQVAALLVALLCAASWRPTPEWLSALQPALYWGRYVFWGLGYFLFIYGIVLTATVALRIFRVSRWYNSFLVYELSRKSKQQTTAATNDPAEG